MGAINNYASVYAVDYNEIPVAANGEADKVGDTWVMGWCWSLLKDDDVDAQINQKASHIQDNYAGDDSGVEENGKRVGVDDDDDDATCITWLCQLVYFTRMVGMDRSAVGLYEWMA